MKQGARTKNQSIKLDREGQGSLLNGPEWKTAYI